jgi:hypothetical protein
VIPHVHPVVRKATFYGIILTIFYGYGGQNSYVMIIPGFVLLSFKYSALPGAAGQLLGMRRQDG